MVIIAGGTAIYLDQTKRKTSIKLKYLLRILSILGMLVNPVFALPLFHVFILGIVCDEQDGFHGTLSCYEGVYFLHLTVAIIGLLMTIIISLLCNFLYIEISPFSKLPFAGPISTSRIGIAKLLLKIAIALYITLDWKVTFLNNPKQLII